MVNVGQYLVNNCKYSGVYEMFNHLYGEDALVKPNGTMGTVPLRGRFYEFDQSEFFDKKGFFSKSAGMDDVGFAYIPSRCSVPEKMSLMIIQQLYINLTVNLQLLCTDVHKQGICTFFILISGIDYIRMKTGLQTNLWGQVSKNHRILGSCRTK